jgi:hypothetical protein
MELYDERPRNGHGRGSDRLGALHDGTRSKLRAGFLSNHTVKIVAPEAPGTVADLVPRLVAEKLAVRWSQAVVVENRPGGGTGRTGRLYATLVRPDQHVAWRGNRVPEDADALWHRLIGAAGRS